jgi:hypothetical protein
VHVTIGEDGGFVYSAGELVTSSTASSV